MKKFLIAASVIFAAASTASAADLAPNVYTKALAPASAYDWSGFYVGGDAGWQGSNIGLSSPDDPLVFSSTYAPHHNSFALGTHFGYQRQWGQLVLGVESDYTAGFGKSAQLATFSLPIFIPGGTGSANAKLNDIWTVGGRAGWALNNWMLYATGGYASGSFAFHAEDSDSTEDAAARLSGYYIGGGVEWAPWHNDWLLGVEYRHYDFGAKSVLSSTTGSADPEFVTFKPTTDTVMARVSYRFGASVFGP